MLAFCHDAFHANCFIFFWEALRITNKKTKRKSEVDYKYDDLYEREKKKKRKGKKKSMNYRFFFLHLFCFRLLFSGLGLGLGLACL